MKPIDALEYKDIIQIKQYIQTQESVICGPLDIVLAEWNKNKTKLFKAFGNKLRISIPIEIERNTIMLQNELQNIYKPFIVKDSFDRDWLKEVSPNSSQFSEGSSFIISVLKYASNFMSIEELNVFSRMFSYSNLESGYLRLVKYHKVLTDYRFESLEFSVKNNTKIIKVIQKILKKMNYPYMDRFESWKNQINKINDHQIIKTNLVFSIHPIDFMTMSNNACNWTSCMAWKTGSYSNGTLEMMNSNMAIVAYLEHKKPYKLYSDKDDIMAPIPNKSWRALIFAHKNIIVCGKSYPFYNEKLSQQAIIEIQKVFKNSLGWKYQYKLQKYSDMIHQHSNIWLREEATRENFKYQINGKEKHSIYLYTYSMYNDILQDRDSTYWCCRNYVDKSLLLCISGPATCICCGQRIYSREDYGYMREGDSIKICEKCGESRKCDFCGEVNYYAKYAEINQYRFKEESYSKYIANRVCVTHPHACDCCKEDLYYFPERKEFRHLNDPFFSQLKKNYAYLHYSIVENQRKEDPDGISFSYSF